MAVMVLVVGGYWLGSTIQCHSCVAISHQTRRSRVRCGGWMDGWMDLSGACLAEYDDDDDVGGVVRKVHSSVTDSRHLISPRTRIRLM